MGRKRPQFVCHSGILPVSIQLPSFSYMYIPKDLLGNCRHYSASMTGVEITYGLIQTTCIHTEEQKNKEGVLPRATPPRISLLIMLLHSLLPVSHHNQQHLCTEVWPKKVWQQTAVNYWNLKNVIFFIMTSFNSKYALDRLSIAFQWPLFRGRSGERLPLNKRRVLWKARFRGFLYTTLPSRSAQAWKSARSVSSASREGIWPIDHLMTLDISEYLWCRLCSNREMSFFEWCLKSIVCSALTHC